MTIYDGVVTLADDDIPVIVELDDGHIRLSASGREIGQWRSDECQIVHLEDSTYTISAENETLRFVPSQPTLFAAAIDVGRRREELSPPSRPEHLPDTEMAVDAEPAAAIDASGDGIAEAPPPRAVTVGLFYALCALTAAMGIWAVVRMVL